jgi:hypothetical protein
MDGPYIAHTNGKGEPVSSKAENPYSKFWKMNFIRVVVFKNRIKYRIRAAHLVLGEFRRRFK